MGPIGIQELLLILLLIGGLVWVVDTCRLRHKRIS